ncbi:DUF58 domain-containing protein [Luteimicrobium subarcticum]|uniref:Uncharacterized protein (DUF58 family) n=1 Tax=Luteimicrobium subarcticum TaxID=620910 RepID=A0A2M8W1N1_9MICO|nr:DUF58 domain-containing protein [Luteimicrobium subarcticum]PJI84819.1 uncharacterized protein (DUF58 family) [Luteimicrobium subarcticum]
MSDPGTAHPPLRSAGSLAGTVAGLVVLVVGVAAGRVDVVLLGVPLLVASLWTRVPSAGGVAQVAVEHAEAPTGRVGYRIRLEPPPSAEALHVRVVLSTGRRRDLVVAPGARELVGSAPTWHTGPVAVATVGHRVLGEDAVWAGPPVGPVRLRRVVLPQRVELDGPLPLPPRLTGLTGLHASVRLGDGGELHDINPFVPGDRLRRIDWRATARLRRGPGDLYVRRTTAQSDATVVIAVDTRDEVSDHVATWTTPAGLVERTTSLDLAREAASSLAAAYVHAGDQVAFHDLADQGRVVPPGAGRRHLDRVRRAAAGMVATGLWTPRLRAPVVARGALVYLVGTHLDDTTSELATTWFLAGHRVVLVDVLPHLDRHDLDAREAVATQLLEGERAERIDGLRDLGIGVLDWRRSGFDADRTGSLRGLVRAGRGHR